MAARAQGLPKGAGGTPQPCAQRFAGAPVREPVSSANAPALPLRQPQVSQRQPAQIVGACCLGYVLRIQPRSAGATLALPEEPGRAGVRAGQLDPAWRKRPPHTPTGDNGGRAEAGDGRTFTPWATAIGHSQGRDSAEKRKLLKSVGMPAAIQRGSGKVQV